jgi:hypothetical protein
MVSTAQITAQIFKKSEDFDRLTPASAAMDSSLIQYKPSPKCPDLDCNEELSDEDGAYVMVVVMTRIIYEKIS